GISWFLLGVPIVRRTSPGRIDTARAEFVRALLRPSGRQTGPPPPAWHSQLGNRAGREKCAAGRPPPPLPRWRPPPASPSPNGRRPRQRSPRRRSPSAAGLAPSNPRRRRFG